VARGNSRATAFFAGDSATMAAVSFAYRTS